MACRSCRRKKRIASPWKWRRKRFFQWTQWLPGIFFLDFQPLPSNLETRGGLYWVCSFMFIYGAQSWELYFIYDVILKFKQDRIHCTMGFWSWKVHWRFQLQCSGRHARHHDSGALYSGGCVRWPENSGRHPARKFCIPKAENVGGEWSWPWPFYSINVQQESFRRHATILLDKFWDKFCLALVTL